MNRMIHKGIVILIVVFCFSLYACAITSITPEVVQENIRVVIPEGTGKFPVVIYYCHFLC